MNRRHLLSTVFGGLFFNEKRVPSQKKLALNAHPICVLASPYTHGSMTFLVTGPVPYKMDTQGLHVEEGVRKSAEEAAMWAMRDAKNLRKP